MNNHTVNEFCKEKKIGRTKFYQEAKAGRLIVRKVGRKSIVTEADGQAWEDSLPKLATKKDA